MRGVAGGTLAAAAYWCSVASTAAVVPKLAAKLGMPCAETCAEWQEAEQVRAELQFAGVCVDWNGAVEATPQMLADYEKTPWTSDFPSAELTRAEPHRKEHSPSMVDLRHYERYQSRVCKVLEAAEAARLWRMSDAGGRANLLTGGGVGTGQFWTRVPRSPLEHLPNAHWRQCVLARLDMRPLVPKEQRCQLQDLAGEPCGASLSQPRHAELCKRGAARMRGHGHLAAALVELSTRVGMTADAERYIPELYEKLSSLSDEMRVKKAIMDVVIGVPARSVRRTKFTGRELTRVHT